MSNIYIPYTYRITSKTTGQHYYGVRYAADCHPDDLWVSYFTSSKYVKEHIDEHGKDDFVIEIRKIFPNDPDSARMWEDKVIQRLNIVRNPLWLNRGNSGNEFFYINPGHSEETKRKIGDAHRGQKRAPFSEEWKKKLSRPGKQNHFFDKTHSEESLNKMRKSHEGRIVSKDTCNKLKASRKGKTPCVADWEITFPDGHIEIIHNLAKFCREHNLDNSNIVSGNSKKHIAKRIN